MWVYAWLRVRQGFAWFYPMALAFVFLSLAGLLPPAVLRESLLAVFLGLIALAAGIHLIFARAPPAVPVRSFADLVVVALVAVFLSGLYWFRAAIGVSGWDGIGFGIVVTLGWWLPAVAFAVLYRHPGEHWLQPGRARFLGRVGVAALAGLGGLPIQASVQEYLALRAERAGLPQAVEELAARSLPDGASMRFEHVGGVLTLNVNWPERESLANYREVAMLRALAGDSGPMRPGGADRLVERVNVDRVHLEVRRGDRTLASMTWPQAGLERGAQALEIDYTAAGLSPLPLLADLDEILRSLPPRIRTGQLCSRVAGERVWIGRCVESASPATAEDVRSMERDWNGANVLVRELGRVFPAIREFRLELAGHQMDFPQAVVTAWFDARERIPVPDRVVVLWFSDDPTGQPPELEPTAPVEILWRDGQWGPGHNRIGLRPWQVGELPSAGLRVYLLELSSDGGVRLFLEPVDAGLAVPASVTLMPGDSIDWEGVRLRHLWR